MDTQEPKITSNKQKKIETVKVLTDMFAKANAVVFTNYGGLTHKQIEELKKAIKAFDAEFVVAKNSLLTIALAENKMTLSENLSLQGPTGTLFLNGDIIGPLKSLAKTIKELNLPSVKFGIMEKNFITGEQVIKLSTLPSRETLLTQIAVGLKSPISGLHRALNWNLQKLVMTLNAVAKAKPAMAASATTETPIVEENQPEVATEDVKEETPTTNETNEEVKIEGGEN